MRILWLVNIVMPELAEHLGGKPSVFGGWLSGALKAIRGSGHELIICTAGQKSNTIKEIINGTRYILIPSGTVSEMEKSFRSILNEESPDVVHIFGTEYEQSRAMSQAADPDRTVVQVQGALTYIEDLTYAGLPERLCRDKLLHKTLRLLKRGGQSIELQKRSFAQRAKLERETLSRAKYAIGGSAWGNSVARSINPGIQTFDGGLLLRDSFYTEDRWSYDDSEKHSILILFSYPVKGFHKFLEAMPMILHDYPDTQVYVVANTLPWRGYHGVKKRVLDMAPDYNWLIQKQIERLDLKEHLHFLGHLTEREMKTRMLKSNVFVSASIIENQSTTLGEAMILGVPSIASCVGAMLEMINHGEDGFLYPFHEPYLLADAVCKIFSDQELAEHFSENGHRHASRTYHRIENSQKLLETYKTILNLAKEARS